MNLARRIFVTCRTPAIAAVCGVASLAVTSEPTRPNIVVVLADDLGYSALSCNGGTLVQTPHLDRIASEGLRFTNFHVQPLCTPTRVALMTGRGNRRSYTGFGRIDPRETTFARMLKNAGYVTAVAGKWQLGNKENGPRQAGFDTCSIREMSHAGKPKWARYWGGALMVDGVQQELGDDVFAADVQLDWALRWIDANRDRPFLLYLPSPLTHGTYASGPPGYTAGRPAPGVEKQTGAKAFPSLLGHLDRQMGVLTDHLRQRGLAENTLFVFLGDNGTEIRLPRADGSFEDRGKNRTTNAGTHSPGIFWWPGKIKPGVAGDMAGDIDILPTLGELAGADLPKNLDGVSLAGRLLEEKPSPRTALYHYYSPHGEPPVIWAHDPRWKLYGDGRLFDTVADRLESRPIPPGTPEADAARQRLQAVLDQNATISEPKIGRGGKRGAEES